MVPYYVYVLLCEDGSYYTGYAKDVDSRVKRHMRGIGARYTKLHRPKRLVYTEEFDTRKEAMKREREIKKLSHDEKHKLVSHAHNPCDFSFYDLFILP
ncbi:MAG: GIY-YIG nuclease family protein [Candidatus Bathyarchaeota archaeon]|nr:GIY-YIG nuclease family protein [Candidatus Bathyarchaeota archaeon]